MRKFTIGYNDPFKQYLCGILEQISYFNDLDEKTFQELVWWMQVERFDSG